jgi:hypothetical protein
MKLDNEKVVYTTISSLMVIVGVVLKNTFEQLGQPNHQIAKPLGMGLFVLGWIGTGYNFSLNQPDKLHYRLVWGCCAAIVAAVIMMKKAMTKGENPHMVLPIVFSLAWLYLGYSSSHILSGLMKYSGLSASVSVLVSMLMALPWQRQNGVIDGPGLPLFVIGWQILVYLNSLEQ